MVIAVAKSRQVDSKVGNSRCNGNSIDTGELAIAYLTFDSNIDHDASAHGSMKMFWNIN